MAFDVHELIDKRVREPFFSRKNTVFLSVLDGRLVVVKIFANGASSLAAAEEIILKRCIEKGVVVPGLVGRSGDVLVLEFVEGETLADTLDGIWLVERQSGEGGSSRLDAIARSLGAWLAAFHAAFDNNTRRGDAVARNFIMGSKGVTGIDFEEASDSDVVEDLGEICSSVMSMHPMFTDEKIRFCRAVADSYFAATGEERPEDVGQATSRALRRYAPYREDGELLRQKAAEIDKKGLL